MADLAAARATDQGMREYFQPLVPPPPKNGGGRRSGAAAPGGGLASGEQARAAAPPRAEKRDGGGGKGGGQTPPRAAAAAASAAVGRKGGKGDPPGGGKGHRGDSPSGPPAGKGGSYYDDYGEQARSARGARSGGAQEARDDPTAYPVACFESGCAFRAKTPMALAGHHCAKHGDAPFSAQGVSREEWTRKRQRSTDAIAKVTGVRPGEPR